MNELSRKDERGHGRVFAKERAETEGFPYAFLAEDDARRFRLLRRHLARKRVLDVIAYPAEGQRAADCHEAHLFLWMNFERSGRLPVMAFVALSRPRVEALVAEGRVVAEDLSLQVSSAPRLDTAALEACVWEWARRCFREVRARSLRLELHREGDAASPAASATATKPPVLALLQLRRELRAEAQRAA